MYFPSGDTAGIIQRTTDELLAPEGRGPQVPPREFMGMPVLRS